MDVALARCLGEDEGVLRIYRWSRPTLSLGRNQPARHRYDAVAAEGLGAEIVRRPTGGREVMHDRELTYALIVPLAAVGGFRRGYHTLNGALLAAIQSLGVKATSAGPIEKALGPESGRPCFAASAKSEIEVNGRKLVGSAQARLGSVLLQHGSILLGKPSIDLEALRTPHGEENGANGGRNSRVSQGTPGSAGITLTEALGEPPAFTRVAQAVEAAFAGGLGGSWRRDEARSVERETADVLLTQYGSDSWTWRT